MPQRLQRDIAVTHFFNPAHVMKLVELVAGEHTGRETIATLADFLGNRLGKGVVYAKDTVNFIGNRIGCFWMLAGLHLAEKAMDEDGLNIETVDALTSAPLGLPATGLYGLIDLIGLDVMYNRRQKPDANLPADDAGRKFTSFTGNVQRLYERGQLGRKSGGGFYKLTRHEDGGKSMEVFDLDGDNWRARRNHRIAAGRANRAWLFESDSANGRFVRICSPPRCAMPPIWCRKSPTISSTSIAPCAGDSAGSAARLRSSTNSARIILSHCWAKHQSRCRKCFASCKTAASKVLS